MPETEEAEKTGQEAPSTSGETGETGHTSEQVEATGSRSEEAGSNGKPLSESNQVNAYIRQLKRMEQRFADLESKFAQGSQRQSQPEPSATQSQEPDFWTDQDSFIRKRAREEASNLYRAEQFERRKEEALNYVQSQDDLKTEDDLAEVKEILAENGLAQSVKAGVLDPMKAADLGLKLWRDSKGISEKKTIQQTASKVRAGGVQASSAPSGKKVWTRAEIADLIDPTNPEKWMKNRDEIALAEKEGRIKG